MLDTSSTPNFYGGRRTVVPRPFNPKGVSMGGDSLEALNHHLNHYNENLKQLDSDTDSVASDQDNFPGQAKVIDTLPLPVPPPSILIIKATPSKSNSPNGPPTHSPPAPLPLDLNDPRQPPSPGQPPSPAHTEIPVRHYWCQVSKVLQGIRCAFHTNRFRNWGYKWCCQNCGLHACGKCKKRNEKGCRGPKGLRRERTA